jgi:protein-L-isoaspartate(D-aspartate) O-methyltransferase
MQGWLIPPPREPTKSEAELANERREKVEWLKDRGLLKSARICRALLKVPREDFIPRLYRDYTYMEVPLPLPGEQATISCPHSYPLFYEPLGLDAGHRFLEVGLGSGYGAAVAREVVGEDGLVVSLDIDPVTFAFARDNLQRAGYTGIVLVNRDGNLGYPELQPYDRIAITAACEQVPGPLIQQLAADGKLIAPVVERGVQNLTLFEKQEGEFRCTRICEVLYVPLRAKPEGEEFIGL